MMLRILSESIGVGRGNTHKKIKLHEGVLAIVFLLLAWEAASAYLPPILFPSLLDVFHEFMNFIKDGVLVDTALRTYSRIFLAVIFSFVVCTALGVAAGMYPAVDRFLSPLIQIKQGIPSLCWIIFSILWFKNIEIRNLFIVFISTLPSFYFLARDGVRGISLELWEMMRAWRPTRTQLIFKFLLPGILPSLITGLRVNAGNGARVVVFAELLGGVSGVGYQLRIAQEQFLMSDVMAWAVVLIFWVLCCDNILKLIERKVLAGRGIRGSHE